MPGYSMGGEQGVAVDQITRGLGLALQVADKCLKSILCPRAECLTPTRSAVITWSGPRKNSTGRHRDGHGAVADEARGYRIGDTVDADDAVAPDVCADQGKIRGSLRRQRLECAALIIHEPGPALRVGGDWHSSSSTSHQPLFMSRSK